MIRHRNAFATLVLALGLASGPAFASGPEPEAPAPHSASDGGHEGGAHAATGGEHGGAAHDGGEHGASGHEGDEHHAVTPDWAALAWHVFNLSLLLGVIVYVARTPLMDEVRGRAVEIRKRLTEAARARDEARQRHEELGTRLARFEEEIKAMKEAAIAEAKQEEVRLVERANAEAVRLADTARRNIREEVVRAQVALRGEAVALAVDLAEKTLTSQIQGDDQKRLAGQFLDTVRSDEVKHG